METATSSLVNMSPTSVPRARCQSSPEEVRLIGAVLAGCTNLFADLLRPHLTALFQVVRAKMQYDSEADDIVQTSILKALTRLEQFRFDGSFRAWLMGIAIHEVLQWHRRRRHPRIVTLDPPAMAQLQVSDPSVSPFKECQRREAAGLCHRTIAKLPEKYQVIVHMRDLRELSISETAQLLRLSDSAVKTRHRRARLQMIRFLSAARVRIPATPAGRKSAA
jgi:RNA polymerase sigma-70 factor (ECF subfamily)